MARVLAMAETKMMLVATHAEDDQERATIPFVMANAALAEDLEVTIVLQAEGVRLAVRDYAKKVNAPSFPPLQDLLSGFLEQGGVLMACTPCMKARNIQENDVVQGTRLVAAGTVVAEATSAGITLTY